MQGAGKGPAGVVNRRQCGTVGGAQECGRVKSAWGFEPKLLGFSIGHNTSSCDNSKLLFIEQLPSARHHPIASHEEFLLLLVTVKVGPL